MKTLKEIQEKITNKEKILFIIDYNNRISPYIRTNMSYFFSPIFKRICENWSKKEFIDINIISDKNIKNFKKEFPIETTNINLYGVNGVELEQANSKKINLNPDFKKNLKKLYNELNKNFIDNKKSIIEFEDWSIIINIKGMNNGENKQIKKICNDFIKKNSDKFQFKLQEDTNKIIVFPEEYNINNILDNIISENNDKTIIYIGKDEKTFKYIKKKCSTLKVINSGETLDSYAEMVVFRSKFEEFLSDTNNLYI